MLFRFLAFMLLGAAVAAAQQFPFIPITGPNAPKSSSFLFQDSHGGLWLGGIEGETELRYFDGFRFINPLAGSLPKGEVYGIAEDSDGGIWLASSAGLYRVFHGQLQVFLKDGSAGRGIAKIGRDVFLTNFATTGNASHLMRVSRFGTSWKTEAVIETSILTSFQPDAFGNVVYPCAGGFCEFRTEDALRWHAGMNLPVKKHATSPSFGPVVKRDRLGCIWTRGEDQVAYKCPSDFKPLVLPERIVGTGYPELSETDDAQMVLPSFGQLAIGRPGHFRVISLASGYPSAASHLIGRDGSIWISNANGLFVFPSHMQMEFWTEREGLAGNTWSILPVGQKVFALSGDTVEALDDSRSRWRQIAEIRAGTHLLAGPNDTILASSRTDGVIQMSRDGRVLRRTAPVAIWTLERGPDGEIWAAGEHVYRLSFQAKQITLEPDRDAGVNQHDMALDAKGNLWTCDNDGFFRDSESGWRRVAQDYNLPRAGCASLTLDSSSSIFFGYRQLWMAASMKESGLEASKLVSDRKPNFLGTDLAGRIWNGASDGVYIADPGQARTNQWLKLDRADGLPGKDTNQRSFVAAKDGSVWFGIDSSVVHMFPPDDLVHPRYAPSVFVSGFSVDGGPYQKSDTVGTIQSGANVTAHLGSLQIDRRNALNFRYRLLPRQTAWSASTGADVSLRKLWWGDWSLEVQARIGTGPWSQSALHQFYIAKPFWLSWPVLLGGTFVVAISGGGYRVLRRRRRERDRKLLPDFSEWRLAVFTPEIRNVMGITIDGRYKPCALLARGGFGAVLEGLDLRENRRCAIKVFRQELADGALARKFQQEVAALEAVQHPNVVRIYGHGMMPSGGPYLVMEFIEGTTLHKLLESGPLSPERVARLLRQAAAALECIHGHGIYHRDFKPENVMIRKDCPQDSDLVLIDFSIAIIRDADASMHGLSRAEGTFQYMAPEQVLGYVGASNDIYSLAKVTIEMLTGKRLSELMPDASLDLAERVREFLAAYHVRLSSASIGLLCAALEFDPSRRPASVALLASSLADDLAEVKFSDDV